MNVEEKLKVIVNVYVEQRTDWRSWDEVYHHMLNWFKKGSLSKGFVDDSHAAIMAGHSILFHYQKDKMYAFVSGACSMDELRKALKQAVKKGMTVTT